MMAERYHKTEQNKTLTCRYQVRCIPARSSRMSIPEINPAFIQKRNRAGNEAGVYLVHIPKPDEVFRNRGIIPADLTAATDMVPDIGNQLWRYHVHHLPRRLNTLKPDDWRTTALQESARELGQFF